MLIVVVEGGAIKNHPMNKAAYGRYYRIRGHNFFFRLYFWTFLYGMKWLKIAPPGQHHHFSCLNF